MCALMHELDRVWVCLCGHASPRVCVCVCLPDSPNCPNRLSQGWKEKPETEVKTEDEKLAEEEIKTGSRVAAGGTEKI